MFSWNLFFVSVFICSNLNHVFETIFLVCQAQKVASIYDDVFAEIQLWLHQVWAL